LGLIEEDPFLTLEEM